MAEPPIYPLKQQCQNCNRWFWTAEDLMEHTCVHPEAHPIYNLQEAHPRTGHGKSSGNDWISFVKQTQAKYKCTYKEAMQIASKLKNKSGGAIWNLTPAEKKKYIEDKASGENEINMGSWKMWDKKKAMGGWKCGKKQNRVYPAGQRGITVMDIGEYAPEFPIKTPVAYPHGNMKQHSKTVLHVPRGMPDTIPDFIPTPRPRPRPRRVHEDEFEF